MPKKITSLIYTEGKFGKGFREIVDTDNPNLYSFGRYPTKITAEDLPEDYIKIHSRVIWYMYGYIKTSGIVDMAYKARKINHMFKDAYLYISYKEKLKQATSYLGFPEYTNEDIAIVTNQKDFFSIFSAGKELVRPQRLEDDLDKLKRVFLKLWM